MSIVVSKGLHVAHFSENFQKSLAREVRGDLWLASAEELQRFMKSLPANELHGLKGAPLLMLALIVN